MTATYVVQDLTITKGKIKNVQYLEYGVRVVLTDDSVRILSGDEWSRIANLYPGRAQKPIKHKRVQRCVAELATLNRIRKTARRTYDRE